MSKGYTLIEVFITLAIVSLLLLASTHLMGSFVAKNRTLGEASKVFHLLQFARNQAISRQQSIVICGSSDQQHCSPDWTNGYMVFIESQKDKAKPTPEELLYVENRNSSVKIHSHGRKQFKFTPDGRCSLRGSIDIVYHQNAYRIVVFDSGRSRIQHL